ncbi:hypothetical protein PI124_g12206 [Phytophthora idaei]|nr:hypothetical protein PI124_g12206 [Phytophthora idaei]
MRVNAFRLQGWLLLLSCVASNGTTPVDFPGLSGVPTPSRPTSGEPSPRLPALVAAVLAAGTTPVAVSEQVVGEALATDTTPVGHTAPAVEPAPAPSITPAARSAEAERTAFAAQLELAVGLTLVAQAATAAGSRQAVHTAPTTVLLPATEPAPAARIVATAEVGLTAGSSSLVSTALGSAAPVAPALLFSNLESDPAPNRLVEAGSADTGDHHSAQLKPGDHRP